MRCEFAHDDGAYVLGALSPAERAAFERHMAGCQACRDAVAEIAVLPGLLGRLDPVAARELLGASLPRDGIDAFADEDLRLPPAPEPPRPALAAVASAPPPSGGDSRVSSLINAAAQMKRRERRTRRLQYVAAAVAAACLALVAGFGIGVIRADNSPGGGTGRDGPAQMAAMTSVAGRVPVTAEIGLVSRFWGTEVKMQCSYKHTSEYGQKWAFKLFAYGPDKQKEQIGSWLAGPGETIEFVGATSFTVGQLTRFELTRADETPLLVYEVF